MKKRYYLPGILLSSFAAVYFLAANSAAAADPQLLLTWKAKSYAPPTYAGKILPGKKSQITASIEAIDQGKPVDLSSQMIYWYSNGNLVAKGKGMQTAIIIAPKTAPDAIVLKAELPLFRGGNPIAQVTIPIVQPEAVVEALYPDNAFYGGSVQVKGSPYFFGVADPGALNFSWEVNGQSPTSGEQPDSLAISVDPKMAAGSTFLVTLHIQNPADALEFASKIQNLILSK